MFYCDRVQVMDVLDSLDVCCFFWCYAMLCDCAEILGGVSCCLWTFFWCYAMLCNCAEMLGGVCAGCCLSTVSIPFYVMFIVIVFKWWDVLTCLAVCWNCLHFLQATSCLLWLYILYASSGCVLMMLTCLFVCVMLSVDVYISFCPYPPPTPLPSRGRLPLKIWNLFWLVK